MDQLEGVEVVLGRRTFVVPPITVWAQEQIEALPLPTEPKAQKEALFEQIRLLLEMNYPDLQVAEIKRCVALARIAEAYTKVSRAAMTGLVVTPGEVVSP